MVAFPFQFPDPNPVMDVEGGWRASVSVAPCAALPEGYRWRSSRLMDSRREALAAGLSHLRAIELRDMPGGCVHALQRETARIESCRWT